MELAWAAPHVRREVLARREQLLEQRVAEDGDARFAPQRAQVHEQCTPVAREQRLPEGIGRIEEGAVLVEDGDRVAYRAAPRADTLPFDFLRLQFVETRLLDRKSVV